MSSCFESCRGGRGPGGAAPVLWNRRFQPGPESSGLDDLAGLGSDLQEVTWPPPPPQPSPGAFLAEQLHQPSRREAPGLEPAISFSEERSAPLIK